MAFYYYEEYYGRKPETKEDEELAENMEKLIKAGIHPQAIFGGPEYDKAIQVLYAGQFSAVNLGEFFTVRSYPELLLIRAEIPQRFTCGSYNALVVIGNDKFKAGESITVTSEDFDRVIKTKIVEEDYNVLAIEKKSDVLVGEYIPYKQTLISEINLKKIEKQ